MRTTADTRFIFLASVRLMLASLFIAYPGCGKPAVVEKLKAVELPSDAQLERSFKDRRTGFERLVEMSDEDSHVTRIAYDFTWVLGASKSGEMGGKDRPVGFSEARWEEYKTLFRQLGLGSGISRNEDSSIWFFAASWGISPGGVTKGYMFSKQPEDCSASSLDNQETLGEKNYACKKIHTNWYLFMHR